MLNRRRRHFVLTSLIALSALTASAVWGAPPPACTAPALIVFDSSGSMTTRVGDETRMQSAKRAMAKIIPSASASRPLGLMVYSSNHTRCDDIRLMVEPRLDAGFDILSALDKVKPKGATPLGAAVRTAVAYFRQRGEPALLIVVSDGQETCGARICELAAQLAKSETPLQIHVIGYGLEEEQTDEMRCLAAATGGLYTSVNSTEELTNALTTGLNCPAVSARPHTLAALA